MGDNTTAAFVLSLIAGILILLNGILVIVVGVVARETVFGALGTLMSGVSGLGASDFIILLGIVALIIGIIVLVGSLMLRDKKKRHTWGIVVLVLSIVSIFFGGGFIIGAILGIVGGILAMTNKKK